MIGKEILHVNNIKKNFGKIKALKGVSLSIHEGEIISIIGENGAGKSTLMNVMTGIYQPDDGEIFVSKEKIKFTTPMDAIRKGICIVHQEIANCPDISVAENIFMSDIVGNSKHFVDYNKLNKDAAKVLSTFDSKIDPKAKVSTLSISEQQIVEIAKALSSNPKVIIFDEPTRGIDVGAKTEIYQTLRKLSDSGVGIIVISSELSEIIGLCDKVCVMYEGNIVGEVSGDDINESNIIRLASNLKEN